ncbi:GHKL domain-containing protein [uncultured Oscillibacter sp.]|uniref:GHKL domain-containing protein n=1 Tax=uncultured Oscillibacter sp. TaxID=876091 RepID=UPI0028038715|nr:GHKL domain-containing protein [uncultured Oscillibacter sp.]
MESPLLYGLSLFIADTPWYVMACVPFLAEARLKKGAILLLGMGAGLLKAFAAGLTLALCSNWRDYSTPIYAAHTVLLLLFYLLAFRAHPAKLAYTLLLLQAAATTVNFSASAAVSLLYPGIQISAASTPAYTAAIAAEVCIAYPFVWRFFKGRLRAAFAELPSKSLWLLCLPPVLFLFLHQIFVTSIQKTGMPTSSISLLTLLVLATGLITYYINLRTLLDNARHMRQESEAETRLALQAADFEALTARIEMARAARHDLRHHINALRDFAARDDKEGMLRYLDEYTAGLPADEGPDWCENRVVNALLKHYLSQAARAGVRLDVKLDLPTGAGVPDTDLCVVFGNIFENAARSAAAAGDGAFLRARCESGESDLVLTVENSAGPAAHGEGLGLRNVEAAARRHGGAARFEEKDGVFYSRVLLQRVPPPAGG